MNDKCKDLTVAANKFLKFFVENLDDYAKKYLRKRNFDDQIIERFCIGLCPKKYDNILSFLEAEKIDYEIAKEIGVIKYDDKNKLTVPFCGRITFPIFNPYNECVGFSCRTLKPDVKPKYINSPTNLIYHKRRTIYGLNFCKEKLYTDKYVFVVEGNLDVIKCHQNNFVNVVCPMGTAFTEEQCKILKRYVNTIVIMFDGDDAGRKAAKDAKIIVTNNKLNCKVINLPDGYDPDTFIDKYKVGKLENYVKHKLKEDSNG